MSRFFGKINGEFPSVDELKVEILGEVYGEGRFVYIKPSKEPIKVVSVLEFEEMKNKSKSKVEVEKNKDAR
jgi:hypothetical protein